MRPNNKLKIERCTAEAALALWQQSSTTTIFTHPTVLAKLVQRVDWWLATDNRVPVCAWPICLNAENIAVVPPFSYYVGPFWTDAALSASPRGRLLADVSVHQGFLRCLLPEYKNLQFSLQPGMTDVRSFLWFPEQSGLSARVNVRPRYSACVSGLTNPANVEVIDGFSSKRRSEVRFAERYGLENSNHCDYDTLARLYQTTMSGSNVELAERLSALRALLALVELGFGYVLTGRKLGEPDAGAASLVLVGKGRACYVIAVADDHWRQQAFNPWMSHAAVSMAKKQGLDCFDFNGANTFDRGSDKHSFGAQAQLYFDLGVSLT